METSFHEPRYKDGKTVALVDVEVAEGVVVKGFRVVKGDKGLFAMVPSKSVQVQGETRYYKQVTFASLEIRDRFLGELLEAYRRWEKDDREGFTSVGGTATSASG